MLGSQKETEKETEEAPTGQIMDTLCMKKNFDVNTYKYETNKNPWVWNKRMGGGNSFASTGDDDCDNPYFENW